MTNTLLRNNIFLLRIREFFKSSNQYKLFMAPTNDKAVEFVDQCVICRQGITRGTLIFVDKKSYHFSCYAAFGQKIGSIKPS